MYFPLRSTSALLLFTALLASAALQVSAGKFRYVFCRSETCDPESCVISDPLPTQRCLSEREHLTLFLPSPYSGMMATCGYNTSAVMLYVDGTCNRALSRVATEFEVVTGECVVNKNMRDGDFKAMKLLCDDADTVTRHWFSGAGPSECSTRILVDNITQGTCVFDHPTNTSLIVNCLGSSSVTRLFPSSRNCTGPSLRRYVMDRDCTPSWSSPHGQPPFLTYLCHPLGTTLVCASVRYFSFIFAIFNIAATVLIFVICFTFVYVWFNVASDDVPADVITFHLDGGKFLRPAGSPPRQSQSEKSSLLATQPTTQAQAQWDADPPDQNSSVNAFVEEASTRTPRGADGKGEHPQHDTEEGEGGQSKQQSPLAATPQQEKHQPEQDSSARSPSPRDLPLALNPWNVISGTLEDERRHVFVHGGVPTVSRYSALTLRGSTLLTTVCAVAAVFLSSNFAVRTLIGNVPPTDFQWMRFAGYVALLIVGLVPVGVPERRSPILIFSPPHIVADVVHGGASVVFWLFVPIGTFAEAVTLKEYAGNDATVSEVRENVVILSAFYLPLLLIMGVALTKHRLLVRERQHPHEYKRWCDIAFLSEVLMVSAILAMALTLEAQYLLQCSVRDYGMRWLPLAGFALVLMCALAAIVLASLKRYRNGGGGGGETAAARTSPKQDKEGHVSYGTA